MKKQFLILLIMLGFSTLFAQVDYKIDAQIRPRFEVNNENFNANVSPVTFTGMRSRIGLKLFAGKNLSAYFQVQDTRIWGQEISTLAIDRNLGVHQAYVIIDKFLSKSLELKFGRMEVNFGPQRLVGAVGWSNVGRSFDGLILKLKKEKFDMQFFAFQEAENWKPDEMTDKFFSGVYTNFKLSKNYKLQPFLLWDRDFAASTGRATIGAYITGKMKKFFHETEFAYQTGKIGGMDIKAYMFAFNAGFKFTKKFTLKAGIDYLSGDDNIVDNEYKSFNTLYATNHKYYGFMDMFLNLPVHTLGVGLNDMHVKADLKASKKIILKAAFHIFNSAQERTLISGGTSNKFGSELDITAVCTYSKNVKFQLGYSMFTPGEIFKDIGRKDNASWAYVMAIVNF